MPLKSKHLSKSTLLSISILINIISLLAISAFAVRAGSLSPSGSPTASMYSLSDIYTRLTTNAAATEGNHTLSSSASPASTMHTLKEIYEAIPAITANTVKLETSYLGIAGTLTPNGGNATTSDLFNSKTANLTNDWNLDSGALNLACNTATFDGTGNKVSDVYDGAGNGSNRWCMTDSGNATSSDILSGKVAWVDGAAISGIGSAGYIYGDSSAAKVLGTATGAGTALKDLFNGTGQGFSQANGGVDDYNAAGSRPVDTYYPASWTQCTSSNHYCGTNAVDDASNQAAYRDESTGLVWSKTMNSSNYALDDSNGTFTWFVANNCTESTGSACTKRTSTKRGCEVNAGWYLPTQKQLMMAYIDGVYGNLDSGVYRDYWASTTYANSITYAWRTTFSGGYTAYVSKANSTYVRCVQLSLGN